MELQSSFERFQTFEKRKSCTKNRFLCSVEGFPFSSSTPSPAMLSNVCAFCIFLIEYNVMGSAPIEIAPQMSANWVQKQRRIDRVPQDSEKTLALGCCVPLHNTTPWRISFECNAQEWGTHAKWQDARWWGWPCQASSRFDQLGDSIRFDFILRNLSFNFVWEICSFFSRWFYWFISNSIVRQTDVGWFAILCVRSASTFERSDVQRQRRRRRRNNAAATIPTINKLSICKWMY